MGDEILFKTEKIGIDDAIAIIEKRKKIAINAKNKTNTLYGDREQMLKQASAIAKIDAYNECLEILRGIR